MLGISSNEATTIDFIKRYYYPLSKDIHPDKVGPCDREIALETIMTLSISWKIANKFTEVVARRICRFGPDEYVVKKDLMVVKIDSSLHFSFDDDELRATEPGAASSGMGSEVEGWSGGCHDEGMNKKDG